MKCRETDGETGEADWGLAWRSIWGFQSESNRTTMSAVYRLMPSPPARVESRKMNFSVPGLLYSSIWDSRSSPDVLPAM